MLRVRVRSLMFLLFAMALVPHILAGEIAQRRPLQTNNASNGLDALGLWQPESVRAILLLYSGKSLSKPKVEELESTIRKTPDKLDERVMLIGYYSANEKTPQDRTRLRTHVLWMIENHPEHPSTGEPGLRDLPATLKATFKS